MTPGEKRKYLNELESRLPDGYGVRSYKPGGTARYALVRTEGPGERTIVGFVSGVQEVITMLEAFLAGWHERGESDESM